ncbi:hypothetical protein LY76DRAFT_640217 [Colletotrichum caudatum]|nr:hypothetical protein LY76DRAFT_640217 [Colletotrichum caudatum]
MTAPRRRLGGRAISIPVCFVKGLTYMLHLQSTEETSTIAANGVLLPNNIRILANEQMAIPSAWHRPSMLCRWPRVDDRWLEAAHPSQNIPMPQHAPNPGLDALTARLVTVIVGEMLAHFSSQSLQCQTLFAAKEEEARVLREQLDSARATIELQVRALNSQATYIRSLEFDRTRSRVSSWPSPAGLDAELLLSPSFPNSASKLGSFSTGQDFDQCSRQGLAQRSYRGFGQHSPEGRAQDNDHQDSLSQDPFDDLAPLLVLAEAAVERTTVNHTAAGDNITPLSAESSPKRKAEDIAGVVKKARPA